MLWARGATAATSPPPGGPSAATTCAVAITAAAATTGVGNPPPPFVPPPLLPSNPVSPVNALHPNCQPTRFSPPLTGPTLFIGLYAPPHPPPHPPQTCPCAHTPHTYGVLPGRPAPGATVRFCSTRPMPMAGTK